MPTAPDYRKIAENDRTCFWKPGSIPSATWDKNVSLKWFPSDTEENYLKRGNKQFGPDDITYDFNEYGYRSRPVDLTSKNKKILFFGCSFTAGIGLPYASVWTNVATDILSRHYGVEFEPHNFALPGHGNDVLAMTAFQTIPVFKPSAVVVLFPEITRRSFYHVWHTRRTFLTHGPQNPRELWESYIRLQSDPQDFYEWLRNWNLVDLTCRANDVPWFWGVCDIKIIPPGMEQYVSPENRLPFEFPDFDKNRDMARDNMHAGPLSNQFFGEEVAKHIIAKGIIHE